MHLMTNLQPGCLPVFHYPGSSRVQQAKLAADVDSDLILDLEDFAHRR